MARLIWKKEYSVNINSIDLQHKRLFEVINDFYCSIKEKKNSEALLPILTELRKYTLYHFSREESLMIEHNFYGLKKHKAEHEKFKQEIASIEKNLREGKLTLSFRVTQFLEEWIINHILRTDKEYSDFLVSRDVR